MKWLLRLQGSQQAERRSVGGEWQSASLLPNLARPSMLVHVLRHARVPLFRLLTSLLRVQIYIKDVKSSNDTFINQERLSPEGLESDPFELKTDDVVVCDSDQYSFDA